jgi:dienelactone hydrolase
MERLDSDFISKGLRCSGWLYLPDGVERPPVVIMAHGFAGQKDFGLQPYAEHFAAKGMAVYLFDYRNFGTSQGEPRNLVNPWRHLTDWNAAISHVRQLDNVDGSRIALWGTSFSGGHVLVTSAKTPGIRAVVSQVPFVDGIATTMLFPISYQVEGFFHGLKDLLSMVTGKAPHLVPAVAEPGTFACMNTPDAMQGYYTLVPPGSEMKNEVPARICLMISAYRPIMYAPKIPCPVLLMYAENDSLIPSRAVVKTGERIPRAEVVGLPVGHFEVYTSELFKKVVERQADFLANYLK